MAKVDGACPCGSAAAYTAYTACCARWHAGEAAPTAEALMRSRYSAFVFGMKDYLLATWHAATRPAALDLDPAVKWLGLEVRGHRTEGERATVEFVARSRLSGHSAGRATRLHETSRFVREAGRWYYIDGDMTGGDLR